MLTARQRFLIRARIESGRNSGTFATGKYEGNLLIASSQDFDLAAIKKELGAVWVKISTRDTGWGTKVILSAIFAESLDQIKAEAEAAKKWMAENPVIYRLAWVYDPTGRNGGKRLLEPEEELPEKFGIMECWRGDPNAQQRMWRSDYEQMVVRFRSQTWPDRFYLDRRLRRDTVGISETCKLLPREEWEKLFGKKVEFFNYS